MLYSSPHRLLFYVIFLLVLIVPLIAMEKTVVQLKEVLKQAIVDNNLEDAVVIVRKFHDQLLNVKTDKVKQKELVAELFDGLIDEVIKSATISFQLACFILQGAGYDLNLFFDQQKDHMPIWLLNSKPYHNISENADDILKGNGGDLLDSFDPLLTIGLTYQSLAHKVAKQFSDHYPDGESILARRYKVASMTNFNLPVLGIITQFCHQHFFEHFLNRANEALCQAKTELEFNGLLVILIELILASKVDPILLISQNLDISKIMLFKDYIRKFSELCSLEKTLNVYQFNASAHFISLNSFQHFFYARLDGVLEKFKDNKGLIANNVWNIIHVIESCVSLAILSLWTGFTPLMQAIIKHEVSIVAYLLERGAEVRVKNIYGDDSWSLAKDHKSITALLQKVAARKVSLPKKATDTLALLSCYLNSLSLA